MAKLKLRCPKRHVIRVDEATYNKKLTEGKKVKCKTCKKLYDASALKIEETQPKEIPEETTEETEEEEPKDAENNEEESAFKESLFQVEVPERTHTDSRIDDKKDEKKTSDSVASSVQKGKFKESTIETFFDMIFNAIAAKRGSFWKLSDDEKKDLVPLATKILNKYVGSKMGKYSDEVAFGVGFGMLILGRIMMDKEVNKGKKTEKPAISEEKQEESIEDRLPDEENNEEEEPEPGKQAPDPDALMQKYPGFSPK